MKFCIKLYIGYLLPVMFTRWIIYQSASHGSISCEVPVMIPWRQNHNPIIASVGGKYFSQTFTVLLLLSPETFRDSKVFIGLSLDHIDRKVRQNDFSFFFLCIFPISCFIIFISFGIDKREKEEIWFSPIKKATTLTGNSKKQWEIVMDPLPTICIKNMQPKSQNLILHS